MAALAGNFISRTTFCMAAQAVFILNRGAKGMVMADRTPALSYFLMHGMVKNNRFIELSQRVKYNLIRPITGQSNGAVRRKAQKHCHDCTQQILGDLLHFSVTSFWLIFYNLLNLLIFFLKKA
jgi:hypothetical protein